MTELAPGALRLVLVTPDDRPPPATLALVEQGLEGGVTAVLLRERGLAPGEREALYARVVAACHRAGALALVSREGALAARLGADGVHTGFGGPTVAALRERAPGLLVGRSCHWPVQPEDRAADYVTLSPFAPTFRSHPRPLLTPEQVAAVLEDGALGPVVALGGLDAGLLPDLPDRLAGVAVVRALADAADPRGAAALLRSLADGRFAFGAPRS